VMTVVLDASVVVKWIFTDRAEEAHALQALQVLQLIKESRVTVVQPPHWLAEVAAVSVRLDPVGLVKPSRFCTRLNFPS
jgi:predicted nucleic acid-binding protein